MYIYIYIIIYILIKEAIAFFAFFAFFAFLSFAKNWFTEIYIVFIWSSIIKNNCLRRLASASL